MGLYAILIAGGTLPRRMRHLGPSTVKALLELDGRSLLDMAATAAVESGLFDGVAAVGNDEVRQATPQGCIYVPLGETVVDNVLNAYRHFGGDSHNYVVISPDLPFVTTEGLTGFVTQAREQCELGAVLISRDQFLKQFPGAPNWFEKMDGRRVTMGSVFYAAGSVIRKNIPLIRDLYNARKYPWRLAVFMGFPVLWGYLTGTLRIAQMEQRLSKLMDCDVRAVEANDAGLAYDIDTLANYEFAAKLLKTGGSDF